MRLGCVPTDDRWPTYAYWMTPCGACFQVDDPSADRDSARVIRANGQQQLFFSYGYARDFLAQVGRIGQTGATWRKYSASAM